MKYKDDPEVQVRIGCTETSSDATISVTDNGPGVPEEALSKLFDVFYRSDRPGAIRRKAADWDSLLRQKFWNGSAVLFGRKMYSLRDCGFS